jgi:hypothetical protein
MGPNAAYFHFQLEHALAARLDPSARGLTQDGGGA